MDDQLKNRLLQLSLVVGALSLVGVILYLAFWTDILQKKYEDEEEEEDEVVELAFETPHLPTKEKFETYQKWKDDDERFKKEYQREFPLDTLKVVQELNEQGALISESDDAETKKLKEKLSEYYITKTNLDVKFPRKSKHLFSNLSYYKDGKQNISTEDYYDLQMPFIEKKDYFVGLATMNNKNEEGFRFLTLRFMFKDHIEATKVEKILKKYEPVVYQAVEYGKEEINKDEYIVGEDVNLALERHILHDSLAANIDCYSGGEFNRSCIDQKSLKKYQDIEHILPFESRALPYLNSAIPYLSISKDENITHLPGGKIIEAVYFIDMTAESLGGFVDRAMEHAVEIDGVLYKTNELTDITIH